VNILSVVPHLGGGLGKVVLALAERCPGKHTIALLETPQRSFLKPATVDIWAGKYVKALMEDADIVLIHYYDHPAIAKLLSEALPPCRLVFWTHKHYSIPQREKEYPDKFFYTSPVQGTDYPYIWSCYDMSRFFEIKPKVHDGFNVGYVGTVSYKKIHPEWLPMCREIRKAIPEARFTFVGENLTAVQDAPGITFTGHVDDVAPYLAEMDIFFYPLRPDHYGTAEQVLGESMAAGVPPVVMNNQAECTILGDEEIMNGFVASSEEDCVNCVTYLYNDPVYRGSVSRHTRERARELYNIDAMISQWNIVFQELMKQPKKERVGI